MRPPAPRRVPRAGLRAACLLALSALLGGAASAQPVPAAPEGTKRDKGGAPLGLLGGGGKEPIKIDADRLDVFDRENKAVFGGNVVAVQGGSTIRCSAMTVHYKRGARAREGAADAAGDAEPGENGIRKVECAGPVTVVQGDQVATGDSAVFDQAAKRIVLTGNVVLSQCRNVTRGSRLVYDMASGRANMDPVAGGRVSALFVPGQAGEARGEAKGGAKGCPPAPAARPVPNPDAGPGSPPAAGSPAKVRAQAN